MQGFEIDKPVADAAADHPFPRCGMVEHRFAQDQRVGLRSRCADEGRDHSGGMLAIRVHGQHMREAAGNGVAQTMQDGRALAAVACKRQHGQSLVRLRHPHELFTGAVGASVNHHADKFA